MDPLDDVALLQIAILQQGLIEDPSVASRGERRQYGHYATLMEELRVEDPQSFFNYLRMKSAMFDD